MKVLTDELLSINIFIIKHTHPSGRNVMLRSVSDCIDGGARVSVCGRSGGVCQACDFFLDNPSVVQTWAGDESGGYFSAAAGRPHHNITL